MLLLLIKISRNTRDTVVETKFLRNERDERSRKVNHVQNLKIKSDIKIISRIIFR